MEQHEKAKLGLSSGDVGATSTDASGRIVYIDYNKSHKTGVSAENRVNGNVRVEGRSADRFLEKNGTITTQTLSPTASGGVTIIKTKVP